MSQKYVEVKLPKAVAFLTYEEIHQMLMSNPEIYKESLKRGKHIMRGRQQSKREYQKFKKEK